jgi:hypothetical protein
MADWRQVCSCKHPDLIGSITWIDTGVNSVIKENLTLPIIGLTEEMLFHRRDRKERGDIL